KVSRTPHSKKSQNESESSRKSGILLRGGECRSYIVWLTRGGRGVIGALSQIGAARGAIGSFRRHKAPTAGTKFHGSFGEFPIFSISFFPWFGFLFVFIK